MGDFMLDSPHAHLRRPHKQEEFDFEETVLPMHTKHQQGFVFGSQFMLGLTLAGVAMSLLTTTVDLFHVDVFLHAYKLPLQTYSLGSFIFSILNTANDLLGAWMVDSAATFMNRSDLIGISGCIFAVCFLLPFFRWKEPSTNIFDGGHFVASMSLYDTMFSFTAILLGSVLTDNHNMSDKDRVSFMASGKVFNLLASFAAARIGLAVFDADNLYKFRSFLVLLALIVAVMFVAAQVLTRYSVVAQWKRCNFRLFDIRKRDETGATKTRHLQLRQVMRDFWDHHNFWAWVGMELLLESQMSFINSFLKTFVDRLVVDQGVSREYCDWLLSVVRPLEQVLGILCYVPIRRFGYHRVYPMLFAFNAAFCVFMLLTASYSSTNVIIMFLAIYPTFTGAVQSAGFHLVMSDMVLEMKKMHVNDGRYDEPSLAGLFMGANALFCKPAESFLPIFAATLLGNLDISSEGSEDVQKVLFKLLIVPPLIFSLLQWLSWRRYTLTPERTDQMREDLGMMQNRKTHETNISPWSTEEPN